MNAIATKDMPKTDWLAARKHIIGASDTPKVLGLSDYGGPVEVYLDKTGGAPPVIETPRMRAGLEMEDSIARMFAAEMNMSVRRDNKIRIHPEFSFLGVNLDRTIVSVDSDGPGILECKNTNSFALKRKADKWDWYCPVDWYAQVQKQLLVTGYKWAWLAAWVDGWDLQTWPVQPDPEFQGRILAEEIALWVDHIVPRKPPAPRTAEETLALFPRHAPGKTVEVGPEVLRAVDRLLQVKANLAPLEAEKKQLEDTIKTAFGDAEAITAHGQTLATWKACKDGSKFDADAFKAEHAELFAEYTRTTPGARRLLIK